jgi:hypothetical protein
MTPENAYAWVLLAAIVVLILGIIPWYELFAGRRGRRSSRRPDDERLVFRFLQRGDHRPEPPNGGAP